MMPLYRLAALAMLVSAVVLAAPDVRASGKLCYRGVNLSGAEYGGRGGQHGTDYIYPGEETIQFFAHKGMNAIRLPVRWERLQPRLGEPLADGELALLRQTISLIRKAGMAAIIDPHNYAYYDKDRIGGGTVEPEALADFWARMAREFGNQDGIVFGLMNEPHDISAPDWLKVANLSIAAIRAEGAGNLILVPGTIWTGAATWFDDRPGGSNAAVMAGVQDPSGHFAFEFHQYMDRDFSGKHRTCERAEDVTKALVTLSGWLRQQGKRGFMGEFGGSSDRACLDGLAAMTGVLADNSDVWIGWTYWAAGEWWPPEEPLNIQSRAGQPDRPQLDILRSALKAGPADPDRCASP